MDKSGKFDYLNTVKWLNSMANICYIRQPYPKGDWDAILRAKSLIWDEPFLVLFWDDIVDNEVSAASQLIDVYNEKQSPVIATYPVLDNETTSCWIIEIDNDKKVNKFLEKPKSTETDSRNGVIWKYVLTPEIFDYLEKATSWSGDWEIRLADAFELMRAKNDIYWVKIEWDRYDTWSKIWYIKAVINYALKRDNLKWELSEYIKNLDIK